MFPKNYTQNQLITIIESLFSQNSSGVLSLETQVDHWQNQRSCILILREGALVYGGTKVPQAQELCHRLGAALKPGLIKVALAVAVEKANNPNSAREILEILIRIRAFTWQEVEALMNTKVLFLIEKFLGHPGNANWEARDDCDLSYGKDRHGLNWTDLKQELKNRQQQWQSLKPQIPSMDAIPIAAPQQLRLINNPQVLEHFRKSVDGKKTLADIAEKMDRDPLKVAKTYVNWLDKGWVSFVEKPIAKSSAKAEAGEVVQPQTPSPIDKNGKNLPTVLSVDDSAIIQTAIKRALQDEYNILLAGKAVEALEILNQTQIELMLLDLTMPDIDGLEFCKTIRAIPKFRDLPIIMVTARDGLVNKMKGHIAGTSKYLTKPFKPEELRQIVAQYIKK